jgi:putative transposase
MLLETLRSHAGDVLAWCVLPNHYHALVRTNQLRMALREVGRMHGRLAFEWNGEEGQRGRKAWCGCSDRAIRGQRHFWATINYIHHNPVRHGYVKRWQDWPFSSAGSFIERMGREKAAAIWRRYPLLDYGEAWDDPKL